MINHSIFCPWIKECEIWVKFNSSLCAFLSKSLKGDTYHIFLHFQFFCLFVLDDTNDLDCIEHPKQKNHNHQRRRGWEQCCWRHDGDSVNSLGSHLKIKLNVCAVRKCVRSHIYLNISLNIMSKTFSNMSKSIFLLNSKRRIFSHYFNNTLSIDWNWCMNRTQHIEMQCPNWISPCHSIHFQCT